MKNNYLSLFKNSFKKNSFIFLLVVFFQIVYLALMNISFYFFSPILEAIIKGNFQSFKRNLVIMITISLLTILFFIFYVYIKNLFVKKMRYTISMTIFKTLTSNNLYSWKLFDHSDKCVFFVKNIELIVKYKYLAYVKLIDIAITSTFSLILIGLLFPLALAVIFPTLLICSLLNFVYIKSNKKLGNMINEINTLELNYLNETFNYFDYIEKNNKIETWEKYFQKESTKIKNLNLKFSSFFAKILSFSTFSNVLSKAIVIVSLIFLGTAISNYNVSTIIPILSTSLVMFSQTIPLFTNISTIHYANGIIFSYFEGIEIYSASNNKQHLEFKDMAIDIENIKIEKCLYKRLKLKIIKGQKILLIGKNGSGKSLLLNAISGNVDPKLIRVNITVNGNKVDTFNTILYFNYVSNISYFYDATLKNNLLLDKQMDSTKLNELVKIFELQNLNIEEFIDTDNLKYSEGEQARINILRAYIQNKDVLILDESFSNIDVKLAQKILDFLLNQKQLTIFVVWHKLSNKYVDKFDQIININQEVKNV